MLNIKIKQLTIVAMWETIVTEEYNNETIYSTDYCQSLVTVKGLATVNKIFNFLCSQAPCKFSTSAHHMLVQPIFVFYVFCLFFFTLMCYTGCKKSLNLSLHSYDAHFSKSQLEIVSGLAMILTLPVLLAVHLQKFHTWS